MGRIATSLVQSLYYKGTLLCGFLEYKWVIQRHSCNNTQNTQNRLMLTIEFGQRFGELGGYEREIP